MDTLKEELTALLNRHSQENPSSTPDWILAQYLLACLAAWNTGVQRREMWYGRDALAFSPPSGRTCTCQGFCKGRDGLSERIMCSLDGKWGKVPSPSKPSQASFVKEVGRQAAMAKALELVERADMIETEDVQQVADAVTLAVLTALNKRSNQASPPSEPPHPPHRYLGGLGGRCQVCGEGPHTEVFAAEPPAFLSGMTVAPLAPAVEPEPTDAAPIVTPQQPWARQERDAARQQAEQERDIEKAFQAGWEASNDCDVWAGAHESECADAFAAYLTQQAQSSAVPVVGVALQQAQDHDPHADPIGGGADLDPIPQRDRDGAE